MDKVISIWTERIMAMKMVQKSKRMRLKNCRSTMANRFWLPRRRVRQTSDPVRSTTLEFDEKAKLAGIASRGINESFIYNQIFSL